MRFILTPVVRTSADLPIPPIMRCVLPSTPRTVTRLAVPLDEAANDPVIRARIPDGDVLDTSRISPTDGLLQSALIEPRTLTRPTLAERIYQWC